MSGILCLVGPSRVVPDLKALTPAFQALAVRGKDRHETVALPHVALGVHRYEWELGSDFSDGVLTAQVGPLLVAADASLYYRESLRDRLGRMGVRVGGSSPAHLILAAYQAWGPECSRFLDGDFAFVVWDGETRTLHAARDYSGRRPLYYTWIGGSLMVASTIGALRSHPQVSDALNLTVLAETISGIVGSSEDTCHSRISSLPAGSSLTWRLGSTMVSGRHWPDFPVHSAGSDLTEDQAAEQLRLLLERAVEARLPRSGTASVSLSGGWDSTAVFGIAQHLLGSRGPAQIRAVSISFPVGDPGREDDFIQEVTERWYTSPYWLHFGDIPFFRHPVEEAALRDEPFVHPFQHWNSALAEAGRSLGARVMLDGYGGDQLFSVSNAFLAGLLRQRRWRQWLAEARRVRPGGDFRSRFRLMVLPILPAWMLDLAKAMRGGRPLAGYLQQSPAPWIRQDFAEQHDLWGRQDRIAPPGTAPGPPVTELQYYLTAPFFPAIIALASRYSLDAGVEQRSPLYDREVIAFAASRPVSDKNSREGAKRILRRAVRGLLPERVLAPRRTKTGTTNYAFLRAMRRDFSPLAEVAFKKPILPELGIVDLPCLREAVEDFNRGMGAPIASQLYFTMQTELWLRGRAGLS